jgi:hypothetical protein
MHRIGRHVFPDQSSQADVSIWKPIVRIRPLASRVLVVAQTRIEGTWCAYIDAVRGQNHDDEWQEVLRVGRPMLEEWARAIFPEFEGVPYAR